MAPAAVKRSIAANAFIYPKKIYCIDHALVTSTSSGILVNTGYLLENLVSTALRRTAPEIYYFKTKSGREVDFVFHGQDRFRGLIQVCESIVDPQARDHGAQRSHSRVESFARHHCDTWRR
jgi:predicted AAA+ superfamily ATPase